MTTSSALAVLDQQRLIAVRHGLRSVVLTPDTSRDEDDLAGICQLVSAMTRRQAQITEQVHFLQATLGRVRQQVHQLQQQVHQLHQ